MQGYYNKFTMKPFLFVTDLDYTLVGDNKSLAEINEKLEQYRQRSLIKIVYATGRSLTLYQELTTEQTLLPPDALIAAVGTEIYDNTSNQPNTNWSKFISTGWNRDLIIDITNKFPQLLPQAASEQRPFKISFFLDTESANKILPELESLLKQNKLETKLIYSGSKDLDIIPLRADKGLAVQYLQQQWQIAANQTVVCGDSGNDIALFKLEQVRGIIVGNARPELRQWHENNPNNHRYLAKAYCAGGILEGLKHFDLLN